MAIVQDRLSLVVFGGPLLLLRFSVRDIMLFYVETDWGCGIRSARSQKQAWDELVREEGTHHARLVRKATPLDLAHVQSMGGYIPEKS